MQVLKQYWNKEIYVEINTLDFILDFIQKNGNAETESLSPEKVKELSEKCERSEESIRLMTTAYYNGAGL